jgi:hypothetical protein
MIDRGFAIVLVFGTVGHTFGSITKYGGQPEELLWALCASPFIALLAAPIFCGQFVPMIMLLLGLLWWGLCVGFAQPSRSEQS